ncbi:hypothetical protein JYU34_000581 [Plutella xylostella]|uniref:Uncharacterized protein n=1 Tax=Plutella xylostella TaxID=51655 RepID=A0ABQ7R872_PLUXY|nr:hypothetical protein JYU34_000581 [Plutella xylostella]
MLNVHNQINMTSLSSSSANNHPLLDIGHSQGAPQHSVLGLPHPTTTGYPPKVVSPASLSPTPISSNHNLLQHGGAIRLATRDHAAGELDALPHERVLAVPRPGLRQGPEQPTVCDIADGRMLFRQINNVKFL